MHFKKTQPKITTSSGATKLDQVMIFVGWVQVDVWIENIKNKHVDRTANNDVILYTIYLSRNKGILLNVSFGKDF